MTTALPVVWAQALLAGLAVALSLSFVRLLLGPSLPDRVVASDLIGTLGVALVAVAALAHGRRELLDVAMLLALVGFVGTVAFAHHLERSSNDG